MSTEGSLLDLVRVGDSSAVKSLSREETDLLTKLNQDGNTALHYAAANGHLEILEFILQNGADPNARNSSGNTPLHWACFCNQLECVRVLVACSDLSICNESEQTFVDMAASSPEVLEFIGKFLEQQNLADQ